MPETQIQLEHSAAFVAALTAGQRPLYAYINTLLGGHRQAADVLQETNLDLWSKADEYDALKPFLPWAYRFAHFRVLAFRKTQARSRVLFDSGVIGHIEQECQEQGQPLDQRMDALAECLQKLSPEQQALIRQRYTENQTVRAMAEHLKETANGVAARLYRIRNALSDCIEAAVNAMQLGSGVSE